MKTYEVKTEDYADEMVRVQKSINNLRKLLIEAYEYLECHYDEGPDYMPYQSKKLTELIVRIESEIK